MIRKEDVIKMIDEWLERLDEGEEAIECVLLMLKNRVENMPEAVVRGEWNEVDDEIDVAYECSECGRWFVLIDGNPEENHYNFCPNCGARMVK